MYNFLIENYRGIFKADIKINEGKPTLICGNNYSGKTSIAQAVASVLSGTPVIGSDWKKNELKQVVNSLHKSGGVKLVNPACDISWPKGIVVGDHLNVSGYSLGTVSLLDLTAKERVKAIIDFLKEEPTKEMLEEKLKLNKISGLVKIDDLWNNIKGVGWDKLHSLAKEKGAKIKGQWEQVTSENFGIEKCQGWVPAEWESDLEKADEESLLKAVEEAEKKVEHSVAHIAVSEHERKQFEIKASTVGEKEKMMNEKKEAVDLHRERKDAIEEQIKKIPNTEKHGNSQKCPKCGELLMVSGDGKIVKSPTMLTEETKNKIKSDMENATKRLDVIVKEYNQALSDYTVCKKNYEDAVEAKERLEKSSSAPETQIEGVKSQAVKARTRLMAWRQKKKADELTETLGNNMKLQLILSPDGLRKEVLSKALNSFNQMLYNVCTIGKWKQVLIAEDMSITYGGRSLKFCSGSEQFLTRVTLQIAMADRIVIIDAADILDRKGRNGLFTVLVKMNISSLVCMTALTRDEIPPVGKIGGTAYWIEDSCSAEVNA